MLAHTLGAMVVQAELAGDLLGHSRREAAVVLHGIAQTGRDALDETGRLLRLLRDRDDELGLRVADRPEEPPASSPGARPVGPTAEIRRSDLLLPFLFGAIGTIEIVANDYRPLVLSAGAFWLAMIVLCARRRYPLAMPLATAGILVGAGLLGAEVDDPAAWILAGAFGSFAAGSYVPRSRLVAGVTSVSAACALTVASTASSVGTSGAEALMVSAILFGPWAVGVALRSAFDRSRNLAALAERARLHKAREAERGAGAERKRIARDLHDVLANSLSVMIVQASLSAEFAGGDEAAARAAAMEVERSGRRALGEIAQLLKQLGTADDDPGTSPQHGIDDLPALADEYARAGLGVELEVSGVHTPLPAGVDLSSYRIVQEALTNVLKHAPGSPVKVRLGREEDGVAIEVRNGPASGSTPAGVPGGHGLVGLRERVLLFGGAIDAHPTPDGGFLVAARLPCAVAAP